MMSLSISFFTSTLSPVIKPVYAIEFDQPISFRIIVRVSNMIGPLVDALAGAIWPPFLLSMFIGLPSILLYLLELFTMLHHWKTFNSSFFLLFFMRAISHSINYFASFLYQRFGKVGIFPSLFQSAPYPILNILFFCNFYFFHVENLANFFLLLNRLTSVLFILKYAQIWRYAMPFAIVATFLLPLTLTWHIFKLTVFMTYDENNSTFTLNYTYPIYYKDWPLYIRKGNVFLSMVSAVSFMVICLAINLATISVMRSKTSKTAETRQKLERRMTIYALATFLGQFIMAIYMILQYLIASVFKHNNNIGGDFRQEMIVAQQNQFCWVNDLCTVALPAWLLLWASPSLRLTLLREVNALADLLCPYCRQWLYQNGGIRARTTPAPQNPWKAVVLPMREFTRRLPFGGRNTGAAAARSLSGRLSSLTKRMRTQTPPSQPTPAAGNVAMVKRGKSVTLVVQQPKSAWN